MATTQQYIDQLKIDKQNLVTMLNEMGVEASNNETFTSLTPKVGKIVSDPILQDKTIEITENGTQTIKADSGYDGLNNVEITTNVAGSGGGETPEEGYILSDYENGIPTKLIIKGENITKIPSYAFHRDSATLSDSNILVAYVKEVVLPNTLIEIGGYAFYNNKKLKNINLPNTITTIGDYAFYGCEELNLEKLPDLLNISAYSFRGCPSLTIKKIPDTVKSIGYGSFHTCSGLTQISMKPNSISGSSSSNGAFYSCGNLKAVWIGSAISSIGRYSFHKCDKLIKIFIDLPRATVEAMSNYSYAFMNSASKIGIIVCNDDEGFMTQDEFDAIDWATYTE